MKGLTNLRPRALTAAAPSESVGRAMRVVTALLAVAAALALGACGGDGDDEGGGTRPAGDRPADPDAPKPRDSLTAAADRLVAALPSGDCRRIAALALHSTKRPRALVLTNKPPTKDECATLTAFAKPFRGLKADGRSSVFGTGGIVDGHIGRSPIATVFVLDVDGSWKVATVSGSYPQVGSKPAADNDFDANVAKFVDAARARDCKEAHRLLAVDGTAADSPRAAFCEGVADTSDPRSFFNRLAKDPDAKPVPLGKTAEFAFYGLAVEPGHYYTLFASRQPARLRLTRAHARDGVFNWYLARE